MRADDAPRRFSRRLYRREEQADEEANDAKHHQQFD
jgi:hypothetical protein